MASVLTCFIEQLKNIVIVISFACLVSTNSQNNKDSKLTLYETFNDGLGNYKYAYQIDTGISQEQIGQRKATGIETNVVVMKGLFSYIAPDNTAHEVRYAADEEGFRSRFIIAKSAPKSIKLENSNHQAEASVRTSQPNVISNHPYLNQTVTTTNNNTNSTDDRIGQPLLITLQAPG